MSAASQSVLRIALLGNPNCGKTALFNLLTGSRQKVANYAGVTVERREGLFETPTGQRVRVLDLPGAYSLNAISLDETITRLKAYADAGADCLYAPGLRTREQIETVVKAVAPKPFNLLVFSTTDLTMDDIAALGVRRVSVGGALARCAWGGFMKAATQLAQHGRFDGFADAASGATLNQLFAAPREP